VEPISRRALPRWAIAFLVSIVAGCALAPSATFVATPKARYTNPPPTPTLSAIATAGPTGPGRPYTPEQMSTLIRDQEAKHGIDAALQTPAVVKAIANVLADTIYTYDGQPYQRVAIAGSCGEPPILCNLTMTGVPRFTADPDAGDGYGWEVRPQVPLVTLTYAGLGGFPRELVDPLDTLARSLDTEGKIGDRTLKSAEWAFPPPDDAYLLCYSHNLDVENPSLEDPSVCVKVDRAARQILAIGPEP
jgi:hypothetical protein